MTVSGEKRSASPTAEAKRRELNIEETRDYIRENLGEIRQKAQEIVQNEGWDYEVNAELGVRWIPEKILRFSHFSGGEITKRSISPSVKAREKIGGASLYPPLCLLDVQEEESEAEDVLRDSIMRKILRALRRRARRASDRSSSAF